MTKQEVTKQWKEEELKYIKETYEQDGVPDYPARSESWNNYTDMLCKNGEITMEQYENWGSPTECSRPKKKKQKTVKF